MAETGLRLTQALVDRLPPRVEKRGPVMLADPPESYYPEVTQTILEDCRPDEGLWILAAGSLIWNPRMEVAERRRARVEGWQRAFCLTDRRFRGNPDAPGRMMSVDRGGSIEGIVQRMGAEDLSAGLEALLRLEPPVPPVWVEAETPGGTVRAIAFVAEPSFPLYVPEGPVETLADILAAAVGFRGTMAEYLLNTIIELERAGIRDPHLWQLQEMVAERLERLPVREAR